MRPLIVSLVSAALVMGGCGPSATSNQAPQKEPTGQVQPTVAPIHEDVNNDEFAALMPPSPVPCCWTFAPREWEGHLEGAHADYWGDEAAFASAMNAIPRDRPVLVYCAGGGRSGLAAQELIDAGHQEVYNLEDGISGWERQGLPVVTSPAADF